MKFRIVFFLVLFFTLSYKSVFSVYVTSIPDSLVIKIDKNNIVLNYDKLKTFYSVKPVLIKSNRIAEIENIDYFKVDYNEPFELTQTIRDKYFVKKIELYNINEILLLNYLKDLAKEFGTQPVDAQISIKDSKIIVTRPDIDGFGINIDKSTKALKEALLNGDREVTLVLEKIPAKVKKDNFEKLGIKEIIAEGRSNFSGSTSSRIHNIKTAASKFQGLIISPGEEFSFLKNLGPVDGNHGYKKELVIKNNKTIPEYGGGTCQVSTTLFRAAVFSGMKITQRKNHSYPVHYYKPIGFDATVYIPAPDLKFVNNTNNHILLNTFVEGNELVFQIFGTKDGRVVEVDGPHITQRKPDGSMKTYFIQKVSDKNGNLIINDIFRSFYQSPSKFPHPGQEQKFTKKPKDWSKKQWKEYKKKNNIP